MASGDDSIVHVATHIFPILCYLCVTLTPTLTLTLTLISTHTHTLSLSVGFLHLIS